MKKLIILPILLITTTILAQPAKNFYKLFADNVPVTLTKTTHDNGYPIFFGTIPDYYDNELFQMKVDHFASQYSDIVTVEPWKALKGGVYITLAILDNDTDLIAFLRIMRVGNGGVSFEYIDKEFIDKANQASI